MSEVRSKKSENLTSDFRHPTSYHNIFEDSLSVQHANDPVAVTGIMFAVRYHYNSGSLLIQVG